MKRKESWKRIQGHPDYEASNNGRVRRADTQETLSAFQNGGGYKAVSLLVDNKRKCIGVHRLVCMAFIGPPTKERPHVNHINSVRHDNRIENLEWVSPQENVDHFRIAGRLRHPKQGKLTFEKAEVIRARRKSGESVKKIAKDYGVCAATISHACTGFSWNGPKSKKCHVCPKCKTVVSELCCPVGSKICESCSSSRKMESVDYKRCMVCRVWKLERYFGKDRLTRMSTCSACKNHTKANGIMDKCKACRAK